MPDSNIYDYNKPEEILNQIRQPAGVTFRSGMMDAIRGIASIPGAMYKNIDLGIGKTLGAIAQSAGGQIANSYAENPKPMDTTAITNVINRPADQTMPKIALGVGNAAPQPKALTLEEAKAAGTQNRGVTSSTPATATGTSGTAGTPSQSVTPAVTTPAPAVSADTVYSYTEKDGGKGIGNVIPPGAKATGTVLASSTDTAGTSAPTGTQLPESYFNLPGTPGFRTYVDKAGNKVIEGIGTPPTATEALAKSLTDEIERIKNLPPQMLYDKRGRSYGVDNQMKDRQTAINTLLGHLTTLTDTKLTTEESAKARMQAEKDLNAYRIGELGVQRQNAETNAAQLGISRRRLNLQEQQFTEGKKTAQEDKAADSYYKRHAVMETDWQGKAEPNDNLTFLRMAASNEPVPERYKEDVKRARADFESWYKRGLTGPDNPQDRQRAWNVYWAKFVKKKTLPGLGG